MTCDFPQSMSIADELLDCGACGEDASVHNKPAVAPYNGTLTGATESYAIRSGDSLMGLARSFGWTLAELLQHNPHINPYAYQVGETLRVPAHAKTAAAVCPGGPLTAVQGGEDADAIARVHGCSANDLAKANPSTDMRRLVTGQVICLPGFAEQAEPNARGQLRFTPYRAQRKPQPSSWGR